MAYKVKFCSRILNKVVAVKLLKLTDRPTMEERNDKLQRGEIPIAWSNDLGIWE
jgi:hypothetical protein